MPFYLHCISSPDISYPVENVQGSCLCGIPTYRHLFFQCLFQCGNPLVNSNGTTCIKICVLSNHFSAVVLLGFNTGSLVQRFANNIVCKSRRLLLTDTGDVLHAIAFLHFPLGTTKLDLSNRAVRTKGNLWLDNIHTASQNFAVVLYNSGKGCVHSGQSVCFVGSIQTATSDCW